MKKISIIVMSFVFFSLLACTNEGNVEGAHDKVLLKPSFLLENRALEQHLGLTGTAIDFEYHGDKKVAAIITEIWEYGKPVSRTWKMSVDLHKGDNTCSFSTKNIINDSQVITAQEFVGVVNGGTVKSYVDPIPNEYSWSSIYLHDATEYSVDEEMIVYGTIASKENLSAYTMPMKSIEEADWAFVVKLAFLDDFKDFELNSEIINE